ncbi:MAG TPA: 50S ribosomal protein L11 methyltransferase [Streptosporangiaceae bacterium]|nr:50S ribosomal protein L11 methyltransferase [Streptosporangiaceae bacterium]
MRPTGFVRSATRLAPVPFLPELSIYQADDIYALWARTERELGRAGLPPPFWGVPWPGGQALARYLLDHPAVVSGRSVLDLGSGSGLVAIAAAKAGAAIVIASETDPIAVAAIGLNAAINGLPAPVCVGSVCDTGRSENGSACTAVSGARPVADVIVAGDVWYERDLADQVGAYLDAAAAVGAHVLTGDIGRRYFPRGRYRCLASYEVPVSAALEGKQALCASVWQATGTPGPPGR